MLSLLDAGGCTINSDYLSRGDDCKRSAVTGVGSQSDGWMDWYELLSLSETKWMSKSTVYSRTLLLLVMGDGINGSCNRSRGVGETGMTRRMREQERML